MGQQASITENINNNDFLFALCSNAMQDQSFWQNAHQETAKLSFVAGNSNSIPLCLLNISLLTEGFWGLSQRLSNNNLKTGALGGLMLTIAEWLNAASKSSIAPTENLDHILNSLTSLRFLVTRLLQESTNNASLLEAHFSSLPSALKSSTTVKNLPVFFVESLFQFLGRKTLSLNTYMLHLEIINTLFTLFTTTLYGGLVNPEEEEESDAARKHNIFLEAALNIPDIALQSTLTQTLLENFISYRYSLTNPSPLQLSIQSSVSKMFSSAFGTLGSAASSMFYLPVNAYNAMFGQKKENFDSSYLEVHKASSRYAGSTQANSVEKMKNLSELYPKLLGKRSATLLLLILFYRKNDPSVTNNYLNALKGFTNSDETTSSSSSAMSSFSLSFKTLLASISRDFEDEEGTVLLYSLMIENSLFLEYVMTKADPAQLLLPLLHKLYHAPYKVPNHTYMMLILLMILSQDQQYSVRMHKTVVKDVPWVKERIMKDISVGSLVVIVLIKTIQFNMAHEKDQFVNNNCLAIISNSSAHFENLHTYAAMKLVNLVNILLKKFLRLQQKQAPEEEIETYSSFLKTAVETINYCITFALTNNLSLVYELLHERKVMDTLRVTKLFPELASNIDTVLVFFEEKMKLYEQGLLFKPAEDKGLLLSEDGTPIKQESAESTNWSAEDLQAILHEGAKSWKGDNIITFEHFTFKYTEDASTETFFLSYIWSIIVLSTRQHINYDTDRVYLGLSLGEDQLQQVVTEEGASESTTIDTSAPTDYSETAFSQKQSESAIASLELESTE